MAGAMNDSLKTQRAPRRTAFFGGPFVLLLTTLFGVVNWHWLSANVVTYGWDRLDHLITSLAYRDILQQVTPASLLRALAYSSYYPPLFHYGIVALYALFGPDEDVAAMVNVLYLAILLGSTWWIAARWRGGWAAALAALLLGLFPMIFAMSRYLYIDFAQTAMVALCMALLLAAERFSRRRLSLTFGLALGAAFLLKWTVAAFIAAPLLYVIWRSEALSYGWRRPQTLRPNWVRLAAALAGAGVLILLWFALAADAVQALPLGWWQALPLFLLLGGVFYSLFAVQNQGEAGSEAGGRRLRNLLGAGVISAFLMALWYLVNLEFVDYFVFTAYGREDEPIYAFGKYLGEVAGEQIGPWFTLVFVLVAVVWLWQERRRLPQLFAHLSDTAWVLLLWVIVPYFIFSFRVTLAHSRYVMPFLPPFALWMVAGLLQWRPRVVRLAAVTLVLAVGIAQYALISFDELAAWRSPLQVSVGDHSLNLLASGFSIQYPASGVTDPGYAVAPAVLAYVDDQRRAAGQEVVNLGLLVNSYQVHEKHFLYSIYKDFPHVRLRELARNWRDQPAYNQLFDMDYLLVSDTHTFRTNENSQTAVQRILYDPADAFNQAFAPVRQWTLPSGEQLTLYGRRFAALEPGVAPADYQQLLALFGDRLGPGDAVVLLSPDQIYMLGLSLPADAGATIAPLPLPGAQETDTVQRLQELVTTHNRIFLVSHNAEQVDPNSIVELWLRSNLVAATELWAGGVRVISFVSTMDSGAMSLATDSWQGGPTLLTASAAPSGPLLTPTAGGALVVQLRWDEIGAEPRNASLQLLDQNGALIAQEDRAVSQQAQQFVLLIPRSAAPGAYRLALVLYDPATGQRFLTADGSNLAELGEITLAQAPIPTATSLPPLRHPQDNEAEGVE